MRKFLGAGSARRVYQINDTECVKIPIIGRDKAAIIQNKLEFENIFYAYLLDIHCFPKAKSISKNGKKINC